jgi:hypothetical protein
MKSTYILSKVVPATKFYNRTHFSYYLYLSYTAMHLEVIAPVGFYTCTLNHRITLRHTGGATTWRARKDTSREQTGLVRYPWKMHR